MDYKEIVSLLKQLQSYVGTNTFKDEIISAEVSSSIGTKVQLYNGKEFIKSLPGDLITRPFETENSKQTEYCKVVDGVEFFTLDDKPFEGDVECQ